MSKPVLKIQYLLKNNCEHSIANINEVVKYASKHANKMNEYISITDSNSYMVHGEKLTKYVKRKLSQDKYRLNNFTNFIGQANAQTELSSTESTVHISITHSKKHEKVKKIPFKKLSNRWTENFKESIPFTTKNKIYEPNALHFYSHQEFLPCWSSKYIEKKKVPYNTMRIILFTNNFLETVYFYQFLFRREYSYASDKFCTFILDKGKKTQYEFCIKHSENTVHNPSKHIALRIRVQNLAGLEPYLNSPLKPMQHSNPNEKIPLWQTLDPEGNSIIIEEEEATLYHPYCFQEGTFANVSNNSNSMEAEEKIKVEEANMSFETMDSGYSELSLMTESKSVLNYNLHGEDNRLELWNTVLISRVKDTGEVTYHRLTFI